MYMFNLVQHQTNDRYALFSFNSDGEGGVEIVSKSIWKAKRFALRSFIDAGVNAIIDIS